MIKTQKRAEKPFSVSKLFKFKDRLEDDAGAGEKKDENGGKSLLELFRIILLKTLPSGSLFLFFFWRLFVPQGLKYFICTFLRLLLATVDSVEKGISIIKVSCRQN